MAAPAGDANHDGIVNGQDISVVASHWLQRTSTGDVNFDGIVNGQDIAVIASHWLNTAGGGSDETALDFTMVHRESSIGRRHCSVGGVERLRGKVAEFSRWMVYPPRGCLSALGGEVEGWVSE